MNEKAEQMIKCGNFHEAQQILLKIIKYSPDNVDTLTNLALIECKEGNWQSAREFIKETLIIDPSNRTANSTLLQIQENLNFNQ
jgi:tetratricopeptide (TPR) repeat protein